MACLPQNYFQEKKQKAKRSYVENIRLSVKLRKHSLTFVQNTWELKCVKI